jgi:hypothetical protein
MGRVLPLAGPSIAHAITQLPESRSERSTTLTDVDKPGPVSASDAVDPWLVRRHRGTGSRCVLNGMPSRPSLTTPLSSVWIAHGSQAPPRITARSPTTRAVGELSSNLLFSTQLEEDLGTAASVGR